MIQKRINGQQSNRPTKNVTIDSQSLSQRYRYLYDMPELSAVFQNQQSKNMQASQVSLLQKMTSQNDKLCNSSIYDEQKSKNFDTKMVEDMRFSFSNNDPVQLEYKSVQSCDLLNKYQQQQSKCRGSLVNINNQSLELRRQRQALKEEMMNHSIQTIKNKYSFNQRKNEKILQKGENKENKQAYQSLRNQTTENIFQKVVIETKKNSSRDQIIPLSKQILPTIKEKLQQSPILNTKNSLQRFVSTESDIIDARYLQILFQKLDKSKTVKIDKYNCNVQSIKQQFQLIFGIIFYRIKFNYQGFSKKQFVQLCLECLKQLGPHVPIKLFKQLDVKQLLQKQIKEQPAQCHNCRSLSRYEEKGTSLYHLLDSPPRQTNISSKVDHQINISLSKRPYVDLKQTRYENNKIQSKVQSPKKNKSDKYTGKYMKNIQQNDKILLQSKNTNQAKYQSVKIEQKLEKTSRYSFGDKQKKYMANPSGQNMKSEFESTKTQTKTNIIPKKKRNISEAILQEHKKNLEQLQKLNQKMENYIYQRPQVQAHTSENPSKLRTYSYNRS